MKSVREAKWNGYTRSTGYEEARQAIADMYTCEQAPLTSEDIIIASGCSGALDLAIGALGDEGSNILVPAPGFSLYTTLASAKGIETRSYKCRVSIDCARGYPAFCETSSSAPLHTSVLPLLLPDTSSFPRWVGW